MSEEKPVAQEGCCKTTAKNCGCKKFLLGLLAGLALAFVVHVFLCGQCVGKSPMMCPMFQTQAPSR